MGPRGAMNVEEGVTRSGKAKSALCKDAERKSSELLYFLFVQKLNMKKENVAIKTQDACVHQSRLY